ncbi:MAG: flavoprotein [Victivallaceae bacterium]|nr:flavoprotein [Victivallaceae bacterium]
MSEQCLVLGITGGIAAYKAADLCSKLVQKTYDVHVIMTASAQELITARTFLTLSRNPVITSLWEEPDWQPGHVALAERAGLLVVAPCTANFIGKLAHGIADDALTTYALTHSGRVLLAPAMNPKMWHNAAVQANVALLKERGGEFIGPESGRVACGGAGLGRMAEPDEIISRIEQLCPLKE